jgi:hypothetical protein
VGLSLQWEPVQRLLDDGLEELLLRHWNEVALDKDAIPLDPDWQRIWQLESQGVFWAAALRKDGRLIGYNAFCVHPHIHYRSTLHAVNDVIFVDPAERGLAGVRLIKGTERLLAEMGVKKAIYHTKLHVEIGHDQKLVGDLLAKMGYKHFENLYCKMIG